MSSLPLSLGQHAPDFTLVSKTAEGPQRITLSDSLKKGPTLLLFFPMIFTRVCTEEFCSLSLEFHSYCELGVNVYGISGDNPFAQEAWAQQEKIIVPLLSDYEHEVAQAYGIAYQSFLPDHHLGMRGVPKRAAFIINQAGVIEDVQWSDDPTILPDFEKIKRILTSLKTL